MSDTHGHIPQSPALAEAKVSSLDELLSSDPLGHGRIRRDAVVAELRERRKGWEAVENAGGHKRSAKGSTKAATKPAANMPEMDI